MISNEKRTINIEHRQVSKSIGLYSLLWIACAFIILAIFKYNNKELLWLSDGVYQHFASFQYLCNYLRDFIYNHTLDESFNFTLGQGMDILTTLNSYDFVDPVSIFCAMIFPLSRVGRYTLMVFIKLYLIGFSFLFYCFSIDKDDCIPTVAGALAYTFSGAILYTFARHPNYINWAYFLPLILGGIELYLRKKEKLPLVLFVFFNILTSYYTFYMNALLSIIYVSVHTIYEFSKKRTLKSAWNEFKKCLSIAGIFCLGILLSACILFPTIYAYLNNARIAEATGYIASLWHYPKEYYLKTFDYLFTPYRDYSYTTYIGLNVIMIIPLVLLFAKRNDNTPLKWLLFISAAMLCVPLAGRIMNGLGYASNRWGYVIPFYVSVAFVTMFTTMNSMTAREKSCVYLLTITYIVLCLLHTSTNSDILTYTSIIMVASAVIAISIVSHYKYPRLCHFILILVMLGSCYQIYFTFAPSKGNYVNTFLDTSKTDSSFSNYSSSAATNLDTEFYRIEMEETQTNINGYNNVYGTGFWWSLVPSYVMNYYTNLSIDSVSDNCTAGNLGGRTGLLALASVKYYTRPIKEVGFLPYGYQEIESRNKQFQVYENQYALPIGYTYSTYIPTKYYENMNGIEKEQALLQGAVLEKIPNGFKETDLISDYNVLTYKITEINNINLNNNTINVVDKNGSITIQLDVPENNEIYAYIYGIKLLGNSSSLTINASRETDDYSFSRSSKISNLNNQWPVLRDDVCFDLGYGYTGENNIVLTFSSAGTISYDDIQIIAVPMSFYVENVTNLGEYVLENVNVGKDKVSGTICIPDDRILQFSIPYSDGWTAYVDGEKVDLLKSDIMYMAIPLNAGDHTIELFYSTPFLKLGFFVSGMTIILWVAFEIINHRRKKKKLLSDETPQLSSDIINS